MNSFSAINRAIDYEISRQILLHKEGQADQIVQETRLWDESSQVVVPNSNLFLLAFFYQVLIIFSIYIIRKLLQCEKRRDLPTIDIFQNLIFLK
jgi:hypothetical protein